VTEPQPRFRIWDLHCHINGVPGRTPDEKMARLVAYADRLGIERLVIYMGYPLAANPTAEELRRQNDQVLQALSHWHHRAFGFAYVSPRQVEASLREIDRCIRDDAMVGIKLWVAGRCSALELDPIVRRAGELNAVIYQHTWLKAGGRENEPGESTPRDLARLAARHPATPLICGHTGGDWEQGIRIVRQFANIQVDLAGSNPTAGFVEMAVRELGAGRVIYGSDVSGRSFASQLGKVLGAKIADESKRLILGENLRRLMAPILRAKGIRT
jgi:predicted TIM-barrel fold metal-dependent hydrolase